MGVDLTLMPVLFQNSWLCHEMITCDLNRDLWQAIEKLGERPVGQPVQSFRARTPDGDETYGDLSVNPYGTPLTWLPAGELSHAFLEADSRKNRAIRAFLIELPSDWPVVLFWH
jgi:hypothetical protein